MHNPCSHSTFNFTFLFTNIYWEHATTCNTYIMLYVNQHLKISLNYLFSFNIFFNFPFNIWKFHYIIKKHNTYTCSSFPNTLGVKTSVPIQHPRFYFTTTCINFRSKDCWPSSFTLHSNPDRLYTSFLNTP